MVTSKLRNTLGFELDESLRREAMALKVIRLMAGLNFYIYWKNRYLTPCLNKIFKSKLRTIQNKKFKNNAKLKKIMLS